MSDRRAEIAERLAESGEQTAALFRSLQPDEWEVEVYGEDAPWRVRDVLAHFSTIENSMHRLFADLLSGGEGTGEDFDLDRFNRSQVAKTAGLDVQELIARFEAARKETVRIVQNMQESDLDRRGRHPFHGVDRLERFIRWAYEHTALHEADIQVALDVYHKAQS